MEIRKEKDVVILTLLAADLSEPGRMSLLTEKLLKEDGENKIVVDLSNVETLYSVQIGTLVTMHCMCYENVAVMKLAGAGDRIKEILRMVGLETLMELHYGVKVAAESFGDSHSVLPARVMAEGAQNSRPAKAADPRVKR